MKSIVGIEPEEWKPISECPAYSVSSLGRVQRTKAASGATPGTLLKPYFNNCHLMVSMRNGEANRNVTRRVASLVARAFIRPDGLGEYVEHEDDCETNNRVDNLVWKTGGSGFAKRKLTWDAVVEIRNLADSIVAAQTRMRGFAVEFGVHKNTIRRVVAGHTWNSKGSPK